MRSWYGLTPTASGVSRGSASSGRLGNRIAVMLNAKYGERRGSECRGDDLSGQTAGVTDTHANYTENLPNPPGSTCNPCLR